MQRTRRTRLNALGLEEPIVECSYNDCEAAAEWVGTCLHCSCEFAHCDPHRTDLLLMELVVCAHCWTMNPAKNVFTWMPL